MASSPPKRRKTSLTTSIPIENATPQAERPAAIDAPHTAPGRASFLSPTKASLARFNPGLLERPRSAGGEGLRDREKSSDMSAVESPTTANGIGKEATNGNDSVPEAAHVAQEVAEERNGERSPSPHETVASSTRITRSTSKQGLRASPRRRSRTPSVVASPPPDQTWEPLATVSESESQIVQGNGDPQPQSEGDREGPVFKALQALAQLDGANDEREPEEPEEPELPPTPSQLGLEDSVMSKPPAGLLNTPSKRPRRNRALGEALKSSPTKVLPTRRLAISPARDAALRFTRQNLESETMGIRKRRRELPGVGEQAERDGASSSKRRKRDVLREQLRKLQDEVAMYEKQAELARKAGDGDGQLPIDLTNEEERGKLISLLLKSNDLSLNPPQPPPSQPLSLLNTLLPFSKPPPITPKLPSSTPDDPLPSHRPISLANPLPYLTLFTPLTFTSTTTTILPQTGPTNQIHHRHLIKTHSPHHLLTATISLTVNTSLLQVSGLEITTLSPWAEPELGSWARERAEGTGVQGVDIAGVCWAMGQYWEAALRRARCWWRCEQAFSELITTTAKGALLKNAPPPPQQQQRRKPPQTAAPPQEPTRRDLSRHLGNPTLHLQRDNIDLLIQWHISFDWTGEPQSTLSATTAVPNSWKQADSRNSLSKIPETFDTLVKERGVFAAAKTIVGVLFP